MTLKEGQNHHSYRVLSMDLDLALERRLEALGLTEGTVVTILNNDKKGSLTARFRGPASPWEDVSQTTSK